MNQAVLVIILFFLTGCSTASASSGEIGGCPQDNNLQKLRSEEMAKIVAEDQEDRKDFQIWSQAKMLEVSKRDLRRRKRVGEIFGEGCLKTAQDFAAAALVYQHGNLPDHFLQTFYWSKRAIELGDTSQKRLMALGLDRYLVNTNRKQLFASQAGKVNVADACWCLEPIEETFPDDLRREYTGQSKSEAFEWLKELNQGKSCPNTECQKETMKTPKGSVPGFW